MNKNEIIKLLKKDVNSFNKWRKENNIKKIDLRGADLPYAKLNNADLNNADLRDADLNNAKLKKAQLVNADLQGADLFNANFQGANLQGANLKGADTEKTNFDGANLKNIKENKMTKKLVKNEEGNWEIVVEATKKQMKMDKMLETIKNGGFLSEDDLKTLFKNNIVPRNLANALNKDKAFLEEVKKFLK